MRSNYMLQDGIPESPLMTIEVSDPAIDLEAYVCVHTLGAHGSSGGLRCVGDVSREEVQLLARAMTYKYAFFGIPQGGAKAGLRIDYDAPAEVREALIRACARHLEPMIKRSTIWSVWTDINFYRPDLKIFYDEIGIDWAYKAGRGGSTKRTAITGFWSIESYAQFTGSDQLPSIAIEGYGGVARYMAGFLSERGYRIVGLSNHLGAVYNDNGLDICEVNSAKDSKRDQWVLGNGNWQRIERDELFQLPVDILVPGARVHAIAPETVASMETRALIPVANVPCTPDALESLDARGIAYLPDYVVNGGGVCGWFHEPTDPFGIEFRQMVGRLLEIAEKTHVPIRTLADEAAHLGYEEIRAGAYRQEGFLHRVANRVARLPGLSSRINERARRQRAAAMSAKLGRVCKSS